MRTDLTWTTHLSSTSCLRGEQPLPPGRWGVPPLSSPTCAQRAITLLHMIALSHAFPFAFYTLSGQLSLPNIFHSNTSWTKLPAKFLVCAWVGLQPLWHSSLLPAPPPPSAVCSHLPQHLLKFLKHLLSLCHHVSMLLIMFWRLIFAAPAWPIFL